tara:strand:- start:11029 stop:11217 length:189 start_codon:yes stop_codon:yes gene_type:complete
MINKIKYFYLTIIEAQHFPGWEIYLFLTTVLWVSIILRLKRIQSDILIIKKRNKNDKGNTKK